MVGGSIDCTVSFRLRLSSRRQIALDIVAHVLPALLRLAQQKHRSSAIFGMRSGPSTNSDTTAMMPILPDAEIKHATDLTARCRV
jgi:hypothetical protein